MTGHSGGTETERLEEIRSLAAHDLREPVRKIRMFTERVVRREADGLEGRSREDLQIVLAAASRLEDLADRITELGRS